jgi:hypothetical protein
VLCRCMRALVPACVMTLRFAQASRFDERESFSSKPVDSEKHSAMKRAVVRAVDFRPHHLHGARHSKIHFIDEAFGRAHHFSHQRT